MTSSASSRLAVRDEAPRARYAPTMSRAPEVEPLLQRVAAGEADAVSACLDRYSALVWSIARGLSQDVAEVEDLVQEVFIELWRNAHRYDPEKASETTFIATIARRRVIDRRRRRARSPESEDLEGVDAPTEDVGLQHVDLGDEAEEAARVVATLRPEQREVIRLSVVEGLTHQQIATTTGLALGTVKSHIRRGLDRVAQVLQARRQSEEDRR